MENMRGKIFGYFTKRELLAIAFTIPAIVISCITFTHTKGILIFWKSQEAVSLKPVLLSMLYAFFFMGSYWIRKMTPDEFATPSKLVLFIMNLWFMASFISVFFSGKSWPIPFINISSQAFLMLTLVFSYLGMRCIAGYSWVVLMIGSLNNLSAINEAMGVLGAVYILCGFISFVFQGDYEDILSQLKQDFSGAGKRIAGDMNEAKNTTLGYLGVQRGTTQREAVRNNSSSVRHEESRPSPTVSPAQAVSPALDTQWYYVDNGAQKGPIDIKTLALLIRSGKLPIDALVYNASDAEGFGKNWLPAKDTKLRNLL
jgi:hypothetical protein